jgi:hypothetical protein
MDHELERLVESLLYEGYALYPYTSSATKNATPTPFGIVYPLAYARRNSATFARARLQCLARTLTSPATVKATVWFLRSNGARHEAQRECVTVPPLLLGEHASVSFEGGRATLRSEALEESSEALEENLWRISSCVHNTTAVDPGPERAAALRHALISTHIVIEISGGCFLSPLQSGDHCKSVNTWPVLATPAADAILGAAIILPDHPQLAPESVGNLFDNTEIEEALLLHVHALSDSEREQIAACDPAVRAMVERAAAATPAEMLALHGRVSLRDPAAAAPPVERSPELARAAVDTPPEPPVDLPQELPGELTQVTVEGTTYRRGERIILRLGAREDPYDRMLDGRTATIRRIRIDMADRAHFAVSLDDDPMHRVLGETGRFLTFFAGEFEPAEAPPPEPGCGEQVGR